MNKQDAVFMAHALRLAEQALNLTHPNPRVGCVLARDGILVGEGWHQRSGGGPHAEVYALKQAGNAARGATAYVTLEPCSHYGKTPPCADALIAAGVSRVVAAMQDPNPLVAGKGMRKLAQAGIETALGLLGAEAERLNRGYCRRMRSGRPWLFSKIAMSLDGRTALASGESKWISSEASRHDVQRLRASCAAVLTGVDTVLADDPALTVRLPGLLERSRAPDRVVLDTQLRFPVDAQMLKLPGRTLIYTGEQADMSRVRSLEAAGADVVPLPLSGSGRLDLAFVADELGRAGFNEVMIEAGATLNGALLQAGLIDEWVIYQAPCALGDSGRGIFSLPELARMSERPEFKFVDFRFVGPDIRLRLQPEK
ncbi:bifunctional diaminohydroxyphosphoribosylaminopyrimidine deaminase/5-amino-6-(5-phosphoribosylamino)uracil reductase RibD [Candidatus Methylospira mobilis]|uniref:bifunctional diaminohydroxyphosphoribosylaminopyrimidine deaminase/5-amino-6-(5-phosphoribosylamino)uracil reductase RibD n=1 Tax=Candidatus Methylospira mobilis TaxID=1808979 RepID=UPI00387E5328